MDDLLAPVTAATASEDMNGLPFDADKMFSDHKGAHKPRVEKKQRALAKKIGFLKDFLEDGETLLAITTAVTPTSFLEQWTTGFVFVYIKRCLLVVTNTRIFHIPTTMGYKYRRSIAQIRYADIETIQQKGSRLKIRLLEKRTHYLSMIANVATLLGLLGTIVGLIQSFQAVASADSSQKAALLSAGISVAMNTTAFGLIVAIPCMVFHSYIQSKTNTLIDEINENISRIYQKLIKPRS